MNFLFPFQSPFEPAPSPRYFGCAPPSRPRSAKFANHYYDEDVVGSDDADEADYYSEAAYSPFHSASQRRRPPAPAQPRQQQPSARIVVDPYTGRQYLVPCQQEPQAQVRRTPPQPRPQPRPQPQPQRRQQPAPRPAPRYNDEGASDDDDSAGAGNSIPVWADPYDLQARRLQAQQKQLRQEELLRKHRAELEKQRLAALAKEKAERAERERLKRIQQLVHRSYVRAAVRIQRAWRARASRLHEEAQRAAVSLIERFYLAHRARRQAQQTVDSLRKLKTLNRAVDELCAKYSFAFAASASGSETPLVKTLATFAELLLQQLIRFDTVETHGSQAVRETRKSSIGRIQQLLERIDARKKEALAEREKPAEPTPAEAESFRGEPSAGGSEDTEERQDEEHEEHDEEHDEQSVNNGDSADDDAATEQESPATTPSASPAPTEEYDMCEDVSDSESEGSTPAPTPSVEDDFVGHAKAEEPSQDAW